MDARPPDRDSSELEAFAAAVAHELRTPLSALSGEVELALRRERTAAAYRDALARIATSVAELVDLTGDLAFLGQASKARDIGRKRARLEAMFAQLAERFGAAQPDVLSIDPPVDEISVAGDELQLARALTLVVEHALKYRGDGARVRVRAASARHYDPTGPWMM